MTPKQIVDISTWTIFKGILVILFFIFLFLIKDILVMLFLSLIIASAIYPWANYLERKKIPRILGVLSVYVAAILFFVLLLYLVVPTIVDEIRQLASVLPSYYETLSNKFSKTIIAISPEYTKAGQDFLLNSGEKIKQFASGTFNAIAGVFGGFATFFIVVVISFYLASQEKGVEHFIRMVTPRHNEEYILNLWKRVEKKLGLWLQGQLLLAFIIGFVVWVVLSLIGVPYALLLGIIAGIFEIIPVVGPIFSALIGIVVALMVSPFTAFLTFLFYLGVQQIENNILVPFLMKKMTGLNPIVVIVALLIGWELGGILGMLISVPVASVANELLEDYAKAKIKQRQALNSENV